MLKLSETAGNKIKGVAGLLYLLAFLSIPLVAIFLAAQRENAQREMALEHGILATATVTKSLKHRTWRGCTFRYEYTVEGRTYEGGEGGCSLVKGHPVGSLVEIRYLASNQAVSHAPGASMWPGWVVVPFLIGISLLFLFGVLVFAIITGTGRRARSKPFIERS